MDNMREYRNIARDQKNVNDNNNNNKTTLYPIGIGYQI